MPERQTMNISLPPAQEQFVRALVNSGRYASASEVMRDGLRLLEMASQQRLLEKWLTDDLSEEERTSLPPDLIERAQAHFRKLVADGIESGEKNGWIDGDEAMNRLSERIRAKFGNEP